MQQLAAKILSSLLFVLFLFPLLLRCVMIFYVLIYFNPPTVLFIFLPFFCCCFSYTCVAGNFCTGTATILIFFGVYFLFCVLLSLPAFSNICLNSASNLHTIVIVLAVQRRISFIFGMNLNCFMSANCARLVGKWRL